MNISAVRKGWFSPVVGAVYSLKRSGQDFFEHPDELFLIRVQRQGGIWRAHWVKFSQIASAPC
jgi:hypothetical protein